MSISITVDIDPEDILDEVPDSTLRAYADKRAMKAIREAVRLLGDCDDVKALNVLEDFIGKREAEARAAREEDHITRLFNEWSRLPREERPPFWDWSHGRRLTA